MNTVNWISRFLNVIAGVALTFLMCLTIARRHFKIFQEACRRHLRTGGFFRGCGDRIFHASDLLGEAAYLCRFFNFEVLPEDEKYLQHRYEMSGDRAVLTCGLEHVEICDGSSQIRRGFSHPADAFLSYCLRSGDLLLCPVPGFRGRYYKNI